MSGPGWQEELRQRLIERNARESAYANVIEQYRRLAQQTTLLKERNQSLLKAVGSVRANPSSSTVLVGGEDGRSNPVRAAYTASLESQVSSLRDEMAALYKTQGQNAQRLLAMNETLREKEETARLETEHLRRVTEELTLLRTKVDQHNELMGEKERAMQVRILHDELATAELELGQLQLRNESLMKDNASLLQRWLDSKNLEAERLNDANLFYDQIAEMKAGANLRQIHSSENLESGNGRVNGNSRTTATATGVAPPTQETVHLIPNG
ncbi:ATG16-domain-containing protein [Hysterangium stoloniferum]|nr:ATG16-domain-containing protein [Hysterangium stoloniferum]